MRILKKFLRILAILLPAFLGVLFLTNNTHAVEDVTYTITSESSSPINLCGWDTGLDCQDYPYIFIDSDIYYQNAFGKNITFDIGYPSGSVDTQIPLFTDSFRFSINSDMTRIRVYRPGTSTLPAGNTITITLSEGSSDCPICEECQPIPENPYDQKFDDIKKAIYVACATILVIYFFYMIYGIIIKPTGGDK